MVWSSLTTSKYHPLSSLPLAIMSRSRACLMTRSFRWLCLLLAIICTYYGIALLFPFVRSSLSSKDPSSILSFRCIFPLPHRLSSLCEYLLLCIHLPLVSYPLPLRVSERARIGPYHFRVFGVFSEHRSDGSSQRLCLSDFGECLTHWLALDRLLSMSGDRLQLAQQQPGKVHCSVAMQRGSWKCRWLPLPYLPLFSLITVLSIDHLPNSGCALF